jgi:hypothetical protein
MWFFFRERGSGEESPGADHSSNNTPETGQYKPVTGELATPLRQVKSALQQRPGTGKNNITDHSSNNGPETCRQHNIPDHCPTKILRKVRHHS